LEKPPSGQMQVLFRVPDYPQNELPEYMVEKTIKLEGGVFIQAESEIAAINMVIGASMAGGRAMTSSSSPGISLKQEGISFLAAQELPAVIVNMSRGARVSEYRSGPSPIIFRPPGEEGMEITEPSSLDRVLDKSLLTWCLKPLNSPTSTGSR